MKKRLRISEAAKFLKVATGTLRKWHLSGKLVPKVHALTGHRSYSLEELEEFLEKNSISK